MLKVEVCQRRSGQKNNSWIDRQTDSCMEGLTDRGTEQWTDEGNDELTDRQINGQQSTQLKE